MTETQFTIDPDTDDGFYVTVGEKLTVYQSYEAAVTEIQSKISSETDSFLAEVTIENSEDDDDDVAISLEQVGWQQIIQDMSSLNDQTAANSEGV
jgi:hypothetical protein